MSKNNKGSIALSFDYGPVSVAYSKSGAGYSVPANYKRKSKLKIKQTGDVYRVTRNNYSTYNGFKEEVEHA